MTLRISNGMMTSDQTEHWAYRDAMEPGWWWVTWLPKAQVCDRNQAITAMTLCEIAAQMKASGGHHLDHPQWPLFCDLAGELGMAGLDALGMVDKPLEPGQTSPEPAKECKMPFIPAITQSAEKFKTATDAYMALDLDDDEAKDTEEYERYVHTAVVLASIVTAEIDIAAKRPAAQGHSCSCREGES